MICVTNKVIIRRIVSFNFFTLIPLIIIYLTNRYIKANIGTGILSIAVKNRLSGLSSPKMTNRLDSVVKINVYQAKYVIINLPPF